jgi:hypothetical protein
MGLGGGKFVGVAVEHLVDDPSLRIQVACVTSSPDVLVGYAAAWPQQAPTTIYVRERWRGIGVERALFEASNV